MRGIRESNSDPPRDKVDEIPAPGFVQAGRVAFADEPPRLSHQSASRGRRNCLDRAEAPGVFAVPAFSVVRVIWPDNVALF